MRTFFYWIKFIFFLGDVTRKSFVKRIFEVNKIDIVFHAAAYKHVPIVELNPLQGIFNNVFSTLEICKFAEINNVGQILLISTDKAVRPTNVMGASKRLAELIIQAFADKNNSTIYSMVRFGNVLGSSGSVVPLFKEQIEKGGPVTITNKNIIRYFMTINEASQLVLQAISLAKTGDLLLLDMGTPMKIIDLAKQMITLSGLTIKDEKNKTKLTKQRIKIIEKALNLGFTEKDLKLIIEYAFLSEDQRARFWRGDNSSKKEYIDIINLFRENKISEKLKLAIFWYENKVTPEDNFGPWRLE